jgi:hypothetical protein
MEQSRTNVVEQRKATSTPKRFTTLLELLAVLMVGSALLAILWVVITVVENGFE